MVIYNSRTKLLQLLCSRNPRQVIRNFLQLVQGLEDEFGCDPVLSAVLCGNLDNEPIVAVDDCVVVVDFGEMVDKFGWLCHILILCSLDCRSHDRCGYLGQHYPKLSLSNLTWYFFRMEKTLCGTHLRPLGVRYPVSLKWLAI